MANIPIPFTFLSNTRDRENVGPACFDMENVTIKGGILEAEGGYSIQVGATGTGTVHGGWLARFKGVEEYGMVRGTKVYTCPSTGTAWTEIATTASDSKHEFQQHGDTVYATSDAGLTTHVIGGTGWVVPAPTAPASGETLFPVEAWYRFTEPVIDWYSIGTLCDVASGWTIANTTGDVTPKPSYDQLKINTWHFDMNRVYSLEPDGWKWTFEFDTPQDFSEAHHWRVLFQTAFSKISIMLGDTIFLEFEDSTGAAIVPTSVGEQPQGPSGLRTFALRHFYFAGKDDKLADVKKIHMWCTVDTWYGSEITDQMEISLRRGSVAPNDSASVDFEAGPIVDSIKYRYTVTVNGTESNLSENAVSSPFLPSAPVMPSSFVRVGLDTVASAGGSDILKLYRQIKATSVYSYVGSALNTGTTFKNTNRAGTLFVDDHYQEWELEELPHFSGISIDQSNAPQVIGAYKGSLVLGIDTNVFISWVNRPEQFLGLEEVPPLGLDGRVLASAGRSQYVDYTASENLNMIVGADVLYLGTRSNIYVMYGGSPRDLNDPARISNNGPIGSRAFTFYQGGIAILNEEGIWLLKPSVLADDNLGTILDEELTRDIETTINSFAPTSAAVLAQHRGDLWAFEGTKYLKLDRKVFTDQGGVGWFKGTLNHSVVVALPDRSLDMRAISAVGELLNFDGSSTFGGTDIAWFYETGDITSIDTILRDVYVRVEGAAASGTISSFYGSKANAETQYALSSTSDHINPFYSQNGNRFRLRFDGASNADKVKAPTLEWERSDDTQDN